jgi:preprotein translocase subunit YajC
MWISNAYAQAAGAASFEQQLMGFLPIILMFVVLYFLMIRPQMKRNKEHRQMIEALKRAMKSSQRVAWLPKSRRSATAM